MIYMGLKDDQEFPTPAHLNICENIILGNSQITTRDQLTEVVQIVIAIPNDRIKIITYEDMVNEFNCPGL
jgi:hypothetical protein